MVAEPLVVEFQEDERAAVVKRMITMANNGEGWINLTPGLDIDFPAPEQTLTSKLFGARGPDVPLATWAPAPASGKEPSTVGIQHNRGPKIIERLAGLGAPVPEGWRKLQDHPKRGLVLALPATTDELDLDRTLEWLLRATRALTPLPRTGEWRALCYRAI
jgi:hypothetical protein